MAEWVTKKLKDIAFFNPKESLAKGTIAKKMGQSFFLCGQGPKPLPSVI